MAVTSSKTRGAELRSADNSLLSNLALRSREIAELLRLNRDEAGYLDKKLAPELIAMVAKAVDMLKSPATQTDAERFLAADILEEASPVEVLIAILRQSFRVTDDLQRRWLTNYLSRLVELDQTEIARQVLLEAAGSEIPALAQLVDEASLQVATQDDLARLALDPYCSPPVRINAAGKLLQKGDLQGTDAALDLIWYYHDNPDLVDELRKLVRFIRSLERLEYEELVEYVIEPTMYMFEKTSRDQPERQKLLGSVVEQIPAAFLRYFQTNEPASLGENWFNIIFALGRCAFYEVGATELLLDWALEEAAPDHIRAECCVRLAHEKSQRPRDFSDRVEQVQDSISVTFHSTKQQEKANEALRRAVAGRVKRSADATYKDLIDNWHDTGHLDRDLAWDLWMAAGSRPLLIQKIRKSDPSTLEFLGDFLTSSIIEKERPDQRCELLIDYATKGDPRRAQDVYEAIFQSANRLGNKGGVRQKAVDFFVSRANGSGRDRELARQYWQRLARPK